MIKLSKVITEEIARLPVILSFDYATKLYTLVDEKDKELFKGDKFKMDNFLITNDARMFSPRYVANFPLSTVNRNEGDITHFSTTALLELLRIRNGSESIRLTICPRAVVKGSDKLLNIEPELLGECAISSMEESSLINFMEVADHEDIKKLIIRKSDDSEEPQIALILGTNKYYPIKNEDSEGFGESLCNVMKMQGCEVDKNAVKEALKKVGLHIFESEENPEDKVKSIVKEQEVVFESKDINQLSKTYIRISANALTENWKVTPIKESGNRFSFEVTGNFKNKNLKDDNYISKYLTEGVYFTRGKLLENSNFLANATFALNNGLSISEAMDALLNNTSVENLITESKKEEEDSKPYKSLFKIKQIVNDEVYKISEWRAEDAKTAKEEFIAANPEYSQKKIEVELIECADAAPAGTTTADMTAVTKDSKVLFPMRKKKLDKESAVSELDKLVDSYGYDADGANFVYEPQSTIDEDDDQFGFKVEVAKELQQMLLDDDGTLAYIDGTEDGDYMLRDAVADYLQAMALPNDLDSVQEYCNWLKDNTKLSSDEAIVDPQYNGADAALAEEEKSLEYYNKKYGTVFGARTKELVNNGMNELEAARKAVAEYSGLEESTDSVKRVQSICNDLLNKKITKDEARELIKAADEDLQDYLIDMMIEKPASFVPVQESTDKKEGALGLIGGAIVGAATTGSLSGAIGSALLTSRLEDQRKATEADRAAAAAKQQSEEWDKLFKGEEVITEAPENNNAEPANVNVDINTNAPANTDANTNIPQDTEFNVNIDNSNDGSIDDLLGDSNIADIDPPVDDQYAADSGSPSLGELPPEDKTGKVIGVDNNELIVQWEDGTTSTEKANNVELS